MNETRNELGNEIKNTQQSTQRDSQSNPESPNLEVPSEIPGIEEDTDSPNHVSKLKSKLNSSSSLLNLR